MEHLEDTFPITFPHIHMLTWTCIVIMRWLDLRKWQKLELSIALFDVWHLLSCNCLVWWPGCRGRPLGNPWDTSTPVGSPHVSDTTSLPYRKSWLNFRGGIFCLFFFVLFVWAVRGLPWDMSTFVVSSHVSDAINCYHPRKLDTNLLHKKFVICLQK